MIKVHKRFKNSKQVDDYFDGDKIQCLICYKWYKSLYKHLTCVHEMSSDDYKKKFNIPWSKKLQAQSTTKKMAINGRRRYESGNFDPKKMRKLNPVKKGRPNKIRKSPDFITKERRERFDPIAKMKKYSQEDFERFLKVIKETGLPAREIYKMGNMPSAQILWEYRRDNPEYAKRISPYIQKGPHNRKS
jgi:hypothetical protein